MKLLIYHKCTCFLNIFSKFTHIDCLPLKLQITVEESDDEGNDDNSNDDSEYKTASSSADNEKASSSQSQSSTHTGM